MENMALDVLRHHITGAIERGEKTAIVGKTETIDLFEYTIASHYLPAIINDDFSGMLDHETYRLNKWLDMVIADANKLGEFLHFDYAGSGEQVARCEITGLLANVLDLLVIFKRKD